MSVSLGLVTFPACQKSKMGNRRKHTHKITDENGVFFKFTSLSCVVGCRYHSTVTAAIHVHSPLCTSNRSLPLFISRSLYPVAATRGRQEIFSLLRAEVCISLFRPARMYAFREPFGQRVQHSLRELYKLTDDFHGMYTCSCAIHHKCIPVQSKECQRRSAAVLSTQVPA